MRIKFLFLLILSMFFINPAFSAVEKSVVRVAISAKSGFEYNSVKISSKNPISIIDMSQGGTSSQIAIVEPEKVIEIKMNNSLYDIYVDSNLKYKNLCGPLLLNSNSELEVLELNKKGTPAKYKGMIEIKTSKNNSSFNVINVIDMQNYLRGVVPNEMPVSFGLEALKAQAVAARNYATNANMSPNYDLVDSTAAQVYYGQNSYGDISDKAVAETKGIYALYKEHPIMAQYFSTSAGITDDWDDVFGNGSPSDKHPYLKARYDKEGQKPLTTEQDVKKFYTSLDGGIDTNSPKYRWSYEFTRSELENILHTTLQQQSKAGLVSPTYDGDIKLEGLKEIKPIKRTQSGKIVELEIIAKNGTYRVKKELGIRRVLKKNNAMLPSANFFVETIGEEKALNLENEEETGLIKLFSSFDDDKYPKTFKIVGGGFGHGVGMSQFGAYNLAKMGKKYPEILNHYYTDINISTFPKTVLFNEYNVWYKTEFYFDKNTYKKAYLYINNHKGASEFPFKINDLEFNSTREISANKVVKIDITQYLQNGMNIINFAPLTKENKGKYVIYRVEFI